MWYVDTIGYLTVGKFPVGVAKYVVWPSTGLMKRISCTHHLWFIPLCLWSLDWQLPAGGFALSVFFTLVACLVAHLTPYEVKLPVSDTPMYINCNLAREFWVDVKIGFLHWGDDKHVVVYTIFLIGVGSSLNGLVYLLLLPFFS
jgi:hypothetical protein